MKQLFMALPAAVLLAACGSSTVAPYNSDAARAAVAGKWTLQTVNGQTLPHRTTGGAGGGTLDIFSSVLTLNVSAHGSNFFDHVGNPLAVPPLDWYDNLSVGWAVDGANVEINVLFPAFILTYGVAPFRWTLGGLGIKLRLRPAFRS